MVTPPTSAATERSLRVRVRAFGRIRELLGSGDFFVDCAPGCSLEDLWLQLVANHKALAELQPSTRLFLNGSIAVQSATLCEGDEVGLLPPVGGG